MKVRLSKSRGHWLLKKVLPDEKTSAAVDEEGMKLVRKQSH